MTKQQIQKRNYSAFLVHALFLALTMNFIDENGILINDPEGLLNDKFRAEIEEIEKHTTVLRSYTELDEFSKYPEEVQKLIRRLGRFKMDLLVKKLI